MSNYSKTQRDNAWNRAKKFEHLFKEPNFDNIMNALTPHLDLTAFITACQNANPKLTTEETMWLWNYLKNMDQSLWSATGTREAAQWPAGTGW
jgi:hypothetical protein